MSDIDFRFIDPSELFCSVDPGSSDFLRFHSLSCKLDDSLFILNTARSEAETYLSSYRDILSKYSDLISSFYEFRDLVLNTLYYLPSDRSPAPSSDISSDPPR